MVFDVFRQRSDRPHRLPERIGEIIAPEVRAAYRIADEKFAQLPGYVVVLGLNDRKTGEGTETLFVMPAARSVASG